MNFRPFPAPEGGVASKVQGRSPLALAAWAYLVVSHLGGGVTPSAFYLPGDAINMQASMHAAILQTAAPPAAEPRAGGRGRQKKKGGGTGNWEVALFWCRVLELPRPPTSFLVLLLLLLLLLCFWGVSWQGGGGEGGGGQRLCRLGSDFVCAFLGASRCTEGLGRGIKNTTNRSYQKTRSSEKAPADTYPTT
jgi:hypothetical protein